MPCGCPALDALALQFHFFDAVLQRVFGDQVELRYVDATSEGGRRELGGLDLAGFTDYPLVTHDTEILFKGRVPAVDFVKKVRELVGRSP